MSGAVICKSYPPPPFCPKEALRYAGCAAAEGELLALAEDCFKEAEGILSYRVCYRLLPLRIEEDRCFAEETCFPSAALARRLEGCDRVLVFAATVGVGIDRLVARYGTVAPSRALVLQGVGAERVEALCDRFCRDMEAAEGLSLGRRFSPGYGDLPLETQKGLFALLDGGRGIGLTLNDSLLMSPTKSVTALVGVK